MSNKLIDLNALSEYKDYSDAKYQDKLTAGTGISIDANNVISATGGGGGVTLPPAFAFNIQEPDFTSTFTLDNAFSTAIANQQFSNYKLGASLAIGGTWPGTLYLAHADYAYGSNDALSSSHHIAALFVGSASKKTTVSPTSNKDIATAIKAQVGASHYIGFLAENGLSATYYYHTNILWFTMGWFANSSSVSYQIQKRPILALFNNYIQTCTNVFDPSNSAYYAINNTTRTGTTTNYYYLFSNGGTLNTTNSATFACSPLGVVLLK